MYDMLSQEMPPGPNEATIDIVDYIITNNYRNFKRKYKNINMNKLNKITFDYYSNNRPEWSLAAWYMGGMREYCDIVIHKYVKYHNARRKIKSIIKTCSLLYLHWRHTVELMYIPGGTFESKMSLIWNPILNPNNIPPSPHLRKMPPPPPNSPTYVSTPRK